MRGEVHKRKGIEKGGVGGNNYHSIEPGGSHLVGQVAQVDISP